ncbi:hypothetical protein [Ochrovirga pacifica]|uniref:hypothetical protein n=1 Tax=Ochrovirga pacifica TaxID=1042376 RepID=UPI00025591CB|nr:hypothetical protein [Ochrovirga pacifica]
MTKKLLKQTSIGFIVALCVCVLGVLFYVLVFLPKGEISHIFATLYKNKLLTKVISLGAIPNVLLFHWFLKKHQIYHARGVLIAMMLLALFFVFLKLV